MICPEPALLPQRPRRPIDDIGAVMSLVANHYGVPKESMTMPRRGPFVLAWPRMVAMYVASRIPCGPTTGEIGRIFGGRDHTTVIHARRAVLNEIEVGSRIGREAADLAAALERLPGWSPPAPSRALFPSGCPE